ncbi:MAG: Asp-tRNA(Asn)/Glu-tRNA(Gln) amidotransferase subunit GatB [Candidatus Omnitrophota bacterium]
MAQNKTKIMKYEPVIGLEVHLHLNTKTKAFCGCPTDFGKEPNSQTCPVCLGLPGSLPVYNQLALEYAIRVALSLSCQVREYTKFDRKNYFYPDLPKNYQISQYDLPLSSCGYLDIELNGLVKRIGITRVHMEEDAGKLIHQDNCSFLDFNRAGVPLLEIVSEPDMNSPEEAYEYLSSLKSTIQYLDVSDCDMEKGSLRCDANISLRPAGEKTLGVKTELKNMNSFKGVKDALSYEISRQGQILDSGKQLTQETRLWDAKAQETVSMRTKEGAKDYRYFPEPDLPPFVIKEDKIAEIGKSLPELPKAKTRRFIEEYGLSGYDAKALASSRAVSEFSEEAMKKYPDTNKKPVANWIIGPLAALASGHNCQAHELKISPANLIGLIELVEKEQVISHLAGKAVLEEMHKTGQAAREIIEEKNLAQVSDSASLNSVIEEAIKENPKSVSDFKAGKANAVMFLVGQAMRKSSGKANPKALQELIKKRLESAQ